LTVTSPPDVLVTVPDDVPADDVEAVDPELLVLRRVVDVDEVRRGALDVARRTVAGAVARLLAGAVAAVSVSSADRLSSCVCCAASERSFWSAALSAGLSPPPQAAAATTNPTVNARILLLSLMSRSSGLVP
jgi:hypothetical protein